MGNPVIFCKSHNPFPFCLHGFVRSLRFWSSFAYNGRNFRFRNGWRKNSSSCFRLAVFSTKGTRYGTPKLKSPARCAAVRYSPSTIPKMPRYPPRKRNPYFRSRNADANSSLGIARDPSAVNATIITTTGLTRLASTVACPIIRPPTIPMAFPRVPGIRTPASRISSKRQLQKHQLHHAGKRHSFPCLCKRKDQIGRKDLGVKPYHSQIKSRKQRCHSHGQISRHAGMKSFQNGYTSPRRFP